MNLLDVIIIALVVSAIIRGKDLGLVRQLGSTLGFLFGLALGVWLQTFTTTAATTQLSRSAIALATVLGSAFIMLGIGEYIGMHLKSKFEHKRVNSLDRWLGSIVGSLTLLLAVWLGAAIVSTMPIENARRQIDESAILAGLNRSLPSTTAVIANISELIDPNGFPKVFIGNEPSMPSNTTVPGIGADTQAAINRVKASVVKFQGLGCGGIVEGTGFVIGPDLVATNAHVIAGVVRPYIRDNYGQHTATPVWFDPDMDFAIVRADNLAGPPLLLETELVEDGTQGAVLGYPNGGPLTAGGAEVFDHFTARGRDIYNQRFIERDVYSIAAQVIPGNSGGPLIASDGTVIGVIFAQSTTHSKVGYALSMPQLTSAINQAQAQNRPVSTGQCARS